ncbi:MAG: RluA family pseudouridine synthase [Spirochaetia bacterium]|nr:RluA family pseudouridine synthase [Spirochaetia bacterium]
MQPPLYEYPARTYALHLQQLLLKEGYIDYDSTREIAIESCFTEGGGSMFGVLVAQDQDGNEILLKAFSGSCQGRRNLHGWVPHLIADEDYAGYLGKHNLKIHALDSAIEDAQSLSQKREFETIRAKRSAQALDHYTNLYQIYPIEGEPFSLAPLFAPKRPPTGSGDCCAIKLLNYAFKHKLRPVSMAEFFFGSSTKTTERHHLQFYGPCDEKCKPILTAMLDLDIVYQDKDLAVVNKPSSMLSVPGRGPENQDCIETRLRRLFPEAPLQCAVHRLDMDTSGLLILALTKKAQSTMHHLFRQQQVQKTYIALIEGVVKEEEGMIQLPFRLDLEHRPKQIYDSEHGKWGITKFKRIRVERRDDGTLVTRILFIPCTGRTHQLRVHSAHPLGLGKPILGDRLYGNGNKDRLYLHANTLSFKHPITGEQLSLSCETPF